MRVKKFNNDLQRSTDYPALTFAMLNLLNGVMCKILNSVMFKFPIPKFRNEG